MGPFSHIEFFAEGIGSFLVDSFYQGKFKSIHPLVGHLSVKENRIINVKYNSVFHFDKNIFVYNVEEDKITSMKSEQFQDYVQKVKKPVRHWTQLLGDGHLKKLIINCLRHNFFLSPF